MDKGDITPAVAGRLVAAQFPQWADLPVVPVALDGWDRVWATVDRGKAASMRVLEKAGMRPAGALDVDRQLAEGRDASVVYVVQRNDWDEPSSALREPNSTSQPRSKHLPTQARSGCQEPSPTW